jgi:GNAT superfamily N-acetyltransferase
MELRRVDPGDDVAVKAYVDVCNRVREVDSPWRHPVTVHEATGMLRFGWEKEPSEVHLAYADGEPVGTGAYDTTKWDNQHLAWLRVEVLPEARRRGHGSAVLGALLDRARAEGRTSAGIDGWESAAADAFALRHGFAPKTVEVCRRQYPQQTDRSALAALRDEAAPYAADYELVRRLGASPDDELDAIAAMTAAINDAPLDDLEIEDEVFTAQRVRDYEDAQVQRGYRLHRVFARHRGTGELAGHTVVVVDGERPHLAEQHDTSVLRAHRGHRLGLLLKADMLDWLADTQPQITSIETWNAASNDHMIGVNEILGYRVMGRAVAYQRDL